MSAVNKTSRVLGVAFLLHFFVYVPYIPFELVTAVWILIKGIKDGQ